MSNSTFYVLIFLSLTNCLLALWLMRIVKTQILISKFTLQVSDYMRELNTTINLIAGLDEPKGLHIVKDENEPS